MARHSASLQAVAGPALTNSNVATLHGHFGKNCCRYLDDLVSFSGRIRYELIRYVDAFFVRNVISFQPRAVSD